MSESNPTANKLVSKSANIADKHAASLEVLARDVAAPFDEVAELFRIEHERLETTAKIKTFVPVFANRQVRTIFALRHNLVGERAGRA